MSVLGGSVLGKVCTAWVGGTEDPPSHRPIQWEGGSVLGGLVGWKVCTGWVGGREGLYWMGR